MFKLDNIGKWRSARVWLDEYPKIRYPTVENRTIAFTCVSGETWERKVVCLELATPHHASSYALLGMEFIPETTNLLEIEIMLSGKYDIGETFRDSMIRPSSQDDVKVGIPNYLAKSITETAQNYLQICPFPAGKLRINIGAHSLVRSSALIFSEVTKMILGIMTTDIKTIKKEDIEKIVLGELEKWAAAAKRECDRIRSEGFPHQ